MTDYTFSIRWLDDENVLLTFNNQQGDLDVVLPIHNYVEFMELAQSFNLHFREKIDQQILKHYING